MKVVQSDDETYWVAPKVPPKRINMKPVMQSLQAELMAEVDRINREEAER